MADKKPLVNYSGRVGEIVSTDVIDGDALPAMSESKKGAVPPTGTPSGKFLRDDNTWATPSGSGGGVEFEVAAVLGTL